jgi:hypothetical protein
VVMGGGELSLRKNLNVYVCGRMGTIIRQTT